MNWPSFLRTKSLLTALLKFNTVSLNLDSLIVCLYQIQSLYYHDKRFCFAYNNFILIYSFLRDPDLEQRVMEIASKAPVQFMEFANGLIVDREKENKISQRIGDPNWWDWDNPYVRKSFLMSLRNNYLEAQKFLM